MMSASLPPTMSAIWATVRSIMCGAPSAGGEFLAVVEGPGLAVTGLARLVALPRDQHDVTRPRPCHRVVDGLATVADLDHLRRRAGGGRACHDRGPDGGGFLVAGIVVGDHDQVGQFGGDAAHRLALARVTVAARAEHHGEPAAALCAQRLEDRPQCPGLVRVVDQGEKALTAVDRLEPAGHRRAAQPRRGLLG